MFRNIFIMGKYRMNREIDWQSCVEFTMDGGMDSMDCSM